jgi:hypothetical protein
MKVELAKKLNAEEAEKIALGLMEELKEEEEGEEGSDSEGE